jgi:hypothetical protein
MDIFIPHDNRGIEIHLIVLWHNISDDFNIQ